MMQTTLDAIRKLTPCKTSWEKGLAYLGKTTPDDEPIDLMTILDVMGVADTVWCFHVIPRLKLQHLVFALAETVAHLDKSGTAQQAIDAGRSYLAGTGSLADSHAAARATATAYAAARAAAAAWAARAAWADAAWAARAAAAYATARDAAAYAAAYAAWAAVRAAKGDPALLAEQRQLVEQFIKENS